MGNIPLQGGASAVDEIDKNLKKVQPSYCMNHTLESSN